MKNQTSVSPAARLVLAGCLTLGLLAVLGTSTGCTSGEAWGVGSTPVAEGDLSQTFAVSPGGRLLMDVDRGAIEISTGGGDQVAIQVFRQVHRTSETKAHQLLEAHHVTFEQEGGTVSVRARLDKPWKSWGSLGSKLQVRYLVTLPRQFDLDLKTAGGSITVPDLTGKVLAGTSGGSIKLAAIDGPVTCKTSGGSIVVGSVTQDLDARTSGGSITIGMAKARAKLGTSGGSIRVEETQGPLDAETSGGNIEIHNASGPVAASTSGGSVTATLAAAQAGDCRLSTSGGNVRVRLPEVINADVDARTSGGSVWSEVPVTVQGKLDRNELVGRLGEGGRLIWLRTSGGSIHLDKS